MKISNFAKRLKEAMEIRNINQTELHEKTGIGKPSISAYLKGDYKAKQDKVDLIAEVLCVDPTWLIGYDVPMERATDTPSAPQAGYYTDPDTARLAEELRTDPDTKILFSAAQDATPEEIQQAAKYLEFLKQKRDK